MLATGKSVCSICAPGQAVGARSVDQLPICASLTLKFLQADGYGEIISPCQDLRA
jgi:hypothetical protein